MKFSFIIASLNKRDKQLQNCIASIEDASRHIADSDVEIIVVFQGLNKENGKLGLRFSDLTKLFHIEKTGLSYARNHAIRNSSGDIFIFIDDDAQIKKDFINVLNRNIKDCSAGAFCGKILDIKTNQSYTVNFDDSSERYLKRSEFTYFMGSSHILKKESLEKIGFYDESFGAGGKFHGAEESDIFFRLKRHGIKIKYIPQLIFYHPISYSPDYSKVFDYSYAVGAMLSKQALSDRKRLPTYLFIAAVLFLKSFLRSIQKICFKRIADKDKRFHYKAAFTGLLKGFICYMKEGIYAHWN